jgi:hypothetical protein
MARQFRCRICYMFFRLKAERDEHIEKEKYYCKLCNEPFCTRHALDWHQEQEDHGHRFYME